MTTKRFLFLLLIAILTSAGIVPPNLEDQRKYSTNNFSALDSFVVSSGQLNGLSTQFNAKYIYYDLYLDTPEFALFKNQYSLRFRKRNMGAGIITYSLQLKSEMDTGSSVRMEVDEPELDFYKIKNDTGWIPLQKVLNVFFDQLELNKVDSKAPEITVAISTIQKWIRFKTSGCIGPFQKLIHLNLPGLDSVGIATLTPVMYGNDIRKRSHVFINPDSSTLELKSIPMNKIPVEEQTAFLKLHPNYNWILEASLDYAVFYPLIPTSIKSSQVFEFEVENKYFVPETGVRIMNIFESDLINKFQVVKERDSKYCRSLKIFQTQ